MSYTLEDNFKAQVMDNFIKGNRKFFDDDFTPTPLKITGTIDVDSPSNYFPEIHQVRKATLRSSTVLIANYIEKQRTILSESVGLQWWKVWKSEERRFQAKPVIINGNSLIQLVDEANGKLTYISPPDSDKFGKKISKTKRYLVTVVVNALTNVRDYIFIPQEIIKTTEDENRRILKSMAESI